MNTIDKIKSSWWVILSFILFLNGFGFIYIGTKHNNRNWILEGIIYELPWFLYFIVYAIFDNGLSIISTPSTMMVLLGLIMLFISIIRSVWVAVKLADVYDNSEKYTVQATELRTLPREGNADSFNGKLGCCACLIVIFLLFVIIAL